MRRPAILTSRDLWTLAEVPRAVTRNPDIQGSMELELRCPGLRQQIPTRQFLPGLIRATAQPWFWEDVLHKL